MSTRRVRRAAAKFGDLYRLIVDNEVERSAGMRLTPERAYDFETSSTGLAADGAQVRYDVRMSDAPIAAPTGHRDGRIADIYVDGRFLRTAAITSGPEKWSVSFLSPGAKHVLITGEGDPPADIALETFEYRPIATPRRKRLRHKR